MFCAYKLKLLGPVGSVGADVGPLLGHDELAADNVLNVERPSVVVCVGSLETEESDVTGSFDALEGANFVFKFYLVGATFCDRVKC